MWQNEALMHQPSVAPFPTSTCWYFSMSGCPVPSPPAAPCSFSWLRTFADLPVLLQDVAPGAGALVAALSVLADEVAGLWGLVTLVQICAPGTKHIRGRVPSTPWTTQPTQGLLDTR